MCIKVSDDERDTIKALMVMSLNLIISDIFQIELDDIELEYQLNKDLHMTAEQELLLKKSIAEHFDGYELQLFSGYMIQHLYKDVVFSGFIDNKN